MTYRNGTYIAFHAENNPNPIETDMKYYRMLEAWHENDGIDFTMVNSHDKANAVRDSSKRETLRRSLLDRLSNSKNFLLIIGETTKLDKDWVPFEIEQAIDTYKLPVIAVYLDYDFRINPNDQKIRNLWPKALQTRIDNNTVKAIHIPFKKEPIKDAISQFSVQKYPNSSLAYYGIETYKKWNLCNS